MNYITGNLYLFTFRAKKRICACFVHQVTLYLKYIVRKQEYDEMGLQLAYVFFSHKVSLRNRNSRLLYVFLICVFNAKL